MRAREGITRPDKQIRLKDGYFRRARSTARTVRAHTPTLMRTATQLSTPPRLTSVDETTTPYTLIYLLKPLTHLHTYKLRIYSSIKMLLALQTIVQSKS